MAAESCGRLPSKAAPFGTRVLVEQSSALSCSVCEEAFTQPVSLACGHTYCRTCAELWFTGGPDRRCPAARCEASAGATPSALPTNYVIQSMVAQQRVHCRFGLRALEQSGAWVPYPAGCQAQLALDEAEAHEAVCGFALVCCPFAGCGAELRRRDSDAHDAEAAVKHARGERAARLAGEARLAAVQAELQARCAALEVSCTSRLVGLELRLAALAREPAAEPVAEEAPGLEAACVEAEQWLGDSLFPRVESALKESAQQPAWAGKVTGMLLDGLSILEVVQILSSPEALQAKVREAVKALQQSKHAAT